MHTLTRIHTRTHSRAHTLTHTQTHTHTYTNTHTLSHAHTHTHTHTHIRDAEGARARLVDPQVRQHVVLRLRPAEVQERRLHACVRSSLLRANHQQSGRGTWARSGAASHAGASQGVRLCEAEPTLCGVRAVACRAPMSRSFVCVRPDRANAAPLHVADGERASVRVCDGVRAYLRAYMFVFVCVCLCARAFGDFVGFGASPATRARARG
jgi:hypothetical protein